MNDESYKFFLGDLISEMIERTKDVSIYATGDFHSGYRMSLYASLSLIETQLLAFGIDKKSVGFGDFDADTWLRLQADYWKAGISNG